ncbi:MAG: patatin-like protein [Acidimicrobiales bacterium]
MTIAASVPPPGSSVPDERWATRELRLAVVCYGGVSLAIYMHGVTKEIHKLVLASAALEADPAHNPFDADTTERVYWDLLSRIAAGRAGGNAAGANIRVVVDIITGTSAGGINGIFLAKAISGNRPQDGLRRLWFEKGDIKELLEWPTWVPWPLRFVARALARRKPPLRGAAMSRWLHGALDDMNGRRVLPGADSLLPDDHVLDLFVPITDFTGYEREIPLYDPRFVRDRTHRHVMHFRHRQPPGDAVESHFGADYDHVLAFSARATSSFPGAFPPVSFDDYARALGVDVADAFRVEPFFPLYGLTGADPSHTHFIDGGVLDNFPFGSAIAAIAGKPAATEVDRRLLFIEPDPGEGQAVAGAGRAPGLVKTVFGGYAGIPRKEPILDDLLRLAERNETVLRVRDVIEASFPSIKAKVGRLVEGSAAAVMKPQTSGQELIAIRRAVEAQAVDQAGFNAATYLRVRIRAVLEHFADALNDLLGFDAASNQSAFVAGVLRAWAVSDDLLEQRPDLEVSDAQVEFLFSLDLPYHRRRVRFLISALSWLYRQAGDAEYGVPSRRQLDVAKATLYTHLARLDGALPALALDPSIAGPLRDVFSPANLAAADTGTDEFVYRPFVAEHVDALVGVRDAIRARLLAELPRFEKGLQSDLLGFLDLCGPRLRDDVLTRYLGFPFWDMLVFPLQSVSDVGERDHVEAYRISPNDTRLLGAQDLRGMSLFHFGAFFDRAGREGDYLWGRLDGAERLVKLLLDVRGHPPTLASTAGAAAREPRVHADELATECAPAFRAILAEEAPALHYAEPLVGKLREIVAGLPAGG